MFRHPRRALAVAVAAAALALAGCVGIPTSGPVVAGPAVDEVDPDFVVTPNGPTPDAEPAAILTGFMLAVRSATNDYAIARQFLTADLADTWNPDAGVLIRTASARLAEVGADGSRIAYSFTTAANVDADGRYREQTPVERTLEFAFALEDGQWRISAAPDGIVLAAVSFERAFAEYPLYFFDASGRYLVPDVRWFPARQNTAARAVQALLAGPDDWLSRSVSTAVPTGTTLGPRSVVVSSGTASVDLSAEAAAATPTDRYRMWQQITATLGVGDAVLTSDGVPMTVTPTGTAAVIDPQPSGGLLIGTGDAFGYSTSSGVQQIDGVSDAIVADGAVAVTLARDASAASYLGGNGVVRRVGALTSIDIDARPGLVAPGLDPFGWTWSGGGASPVEAFSPSGEAAGLVAAVLPDGAEITAIAVSRDGTRLVLGFSGRDGASLVALGVVRAADGSPTGLSGLVELTAPPGPVVSAAWVDDTSVVVSAAVSGRSQILVVPIGAPSEDLGDVDAGATVAGGRGGGSGVHVLAGGVVMSPGISGGWSSTGVEALLLGIE